MQYFTVFAKLCFTSCVSDTKTFSEVDRVSLTKDFIILSMSFGFSFDLQCFQSADMVFLRGLNLTKVVTCSLNPLRVCLPEIVTKFASITRTYQLVLCNSVIERNRRNFVPIVHSKNHVMQAEQPSNLLETFFPFDPYKLRR